MRLTLLRSPALPDPLADYGQHQFVYSLLPHRGSWETGTQREAYALNDPVISYQSPLKSSKMITDQCSLVSVSAPNVLVETVKRAENGNGMILRLYESQRKRGPVSLRFAFPVENAWTTNLLEENETRLKVERDTVSFDIKPYQIMTLRIEGRKS